MIKRQTLLSYLKIAKVSMKGIMLRRLSVQMMKLRKLLRRQKKPKIKEKKARVIKKKEKKERKEKKEEEVMMEEKFTKFRQLKPSRSLMRYTRISLQIGEIETKEIIINKNMILKWPSKKSCLFLKKSISRLLTR
jgi:CO dehydrogenase/acetyl-CoA synthase beta subunit